MGSRATRQTVCCSLCVLIQCKFSCALPSGRLGMPVKGTSCSRMPHMELPQHNAEWAFWKTLLVHSTMLETLSLVTL